MTRVLFLCLGNICRSPMAASIFRKMVKDAGLEKQIEVDSAGLLNYHAGSGADHRTLKILRKYQTDGTHTARQIKKDDLEDFDFILAMDEANMKGLKELTKGKGVGAQIALIRDWDPEGKGEVPDPYYDDLEAFDQVYLMLERSCKAFLKELKSEL